MGYAVQFHKNPWDNLVNVNQKQLNNTLTGAYGINPRVVLGSLIIKHICDLSEGETVRLGRPAAVQKHVQPGERNPVEGKFGQAKSAYAIKPIKARLQQTTESLVATFVRVLNLVKLTGQVLYCLLLNLVAYSAVCLGSINDPGILRKWPRPRFF